MLRLIGVRYNGEIQVLDELPTLFEIILKEVSQQKKHKVRYECSKDDLLIFSFNRDDKLKSVTIEPQARAYLDLVADLFMQV